MIFCTDYVLAPIAKQIVPELIIPFRNQVFWIIEVHI